MGHSGSIRNMTRKELSEKLIETAYAMMWLANVLAEPSELEPPAKSEAEIKAETAQLIDLFCSGIKVLLDRGVPPAQIDFIKILLDMGIPRSQLGLPELELPLETTVTPSKP